MLPPSQRPLREDPFDAANGPRRLHDAEAQGPGPKRRGARLLHPLTHASAGVRRWRVLLLSTVLLLLIGWLDYATTSEFSLQDFYWIPVALAAWCLGARTGYGFAVASVLIANGTDLAEETVRARYLPLVWNSCSQLVSLCILVWILAKLKQLYLEAARLNRLEIDLRASQQAFEELRDFGYLIGHTWHAPLRSIDGYSQALLEDYAHQIGPPGSDYLQRLRRSAHEMAELTNALLDLIKYSGGKLKWEPVDLSGLVESIAAHLNRAQAEHQVVLTCEPGLRVIADGPLLRVALERLMDNAWKFTRHQRRPWVIFGAQQQAEGQVYFLRDNGVGFNMDYARMLFAPYQSAHGAGEFPGVGIGLPIADRIIRRHGGRIWAEGVQGQGATFYFTLGTEPENGL